MGTSSILHRVPRPHLFPFLSTKRWLPLLLLLGTSICWFGCTTTGQKFTSAPPVPKAEKAVFTLRVPPKGSITVHREGNQYSFVPPEGCPFFMKDLIVNHEREPLNLGEADSEANGITLMPAAKVELRGVSAMVHDGQVYCFFKESPGKLDALEFPFGRLKVDKAVFSVAVDSEQNVTIAVAEGDLEVKTADGIIKLSSCQKLTITGKGTVTKVTQFNALLDPLYTQRKVMIFETAGH